MKPKSVVPAGIYAVELKKVEDKSYHPTRHEERNFLLCSWEVLNGDHKDKVFTSPLYYHTKKGLKEIDKLISFMGLPKDTPIDYRLEGGRCLLRVFIDQKGRNTALPYGRLSTDMISPMAKG